MASPVETRKAQTLNPKDIQKHDRERAKEQEKQEKADKEKQEKLEKLEKQRKKQEDKEKRQTLKLLNRQTHTIKKSSIPNDEVVNMYYTVLLDSFVMSPEQREAALNLTRDEKWEKILHHNRKAENKKTESPLHFCSHLQVEPSLKLLQSLLTTMQSKPVTWLTQFIEAEGIAALTSLMSNLLNNHSKSKADIDMLSCIVLILKHMMNHKSGLQAVCRTKGTVKKLAVCLMIPDADSQLVVLSCLLVILVHTPEGYKVVLDAFAAFSVEAEQRRFEILLQFLEHGPTVEIKTVTMSIIEHILTTPEELDFRVVLSQEFIRIGFERQLDTIRRDASLEGSKLRELAQSITQDAAEDQLELEARLAEFNLDFSDPNLMAERLNQQMFGTPVYRTWLAVLRDLFAIGVDTEEGQKAWFLLERLVLQLSLQKKILVIDEQSVKISDLFAEPPLRSNAKVQELESIIATMERMATLKEEELRERDNLIRSLQARAGQLNSGPLRSQISSSPLRRNDSPAIAATSDPASPMSFANSHIYSLIPPSPKVPGSPSQTPSPFANESIYSPIPSTAPAEAAQLLTAHLASAPVGSPPSGGTPPPAPLLKGPPPPKPPPSLSAKPAETKIVRKVPRRKPPQPTNKLKMVPWNKIADSRFESSVWARIGSAEVAVDVKLLEDAFQTAAPVALSSTSGANSAERPRSAHPAAQENRKKREVVSLIDPKRSQNMSVVLVSKLGKVSLPELTSAILSLDEAVLSAEVAKFILSHLPTDEDLALLHQFQEEQSRLTDDAKAQLDRPELFLLEMSKIPSLADRLQSYVFRSTFSPKVEELKSEIRSIKLGAQQLKTSAKVERLLEILLYVGNFMNANSARGDVEGFRTDVLAKLWDTRANAKHAKDRPTLMHFVADLIEEKHPDLRDWPSEVEFVRAAAKASLKTLDLELTTMKKGLRQLELSVASVKHLDERDAFKRQMTEFTTRANASFSELEKSYTDCKQVYAAVLAYFGEDPTLPAEEFFKNWNAFLLNFVRAREEVRKAREKRAKQDAHARAPAGPASPRDNLVDDVIANVAPSQRKRTLSIVEATTPPWVKNKGKPSPIAAAAAAVAAAKASSSPAKPSTVHLTSTSPETPTLARPSLKPSSLRPVSPSRLPRSASPGPFSPPLSPVLSPAVSPGHSPRASKHPLHAPAGPPPGAVVSSTTVATSVPWPVVRPAMRASNPDISIGVASAEAVPQRSAPLQLPLQMRGSRSSLVVGSPEKPVTDSPPEKTSTPHP